MLKLLVCFKSVPDLDTVMEEEWNQIKKETVDLAGTMKILGLYDESALEMALRLADQARARNQEVELTALTIDNDSLDSIMKNLFAVKFNKVVDVTCPKDLRFYPDAVAQIISAYVRKNGSYDAILMGQQASVGDNGQTHLITAEQLLLPCISQVSDMTVTEAGFQVTSDIDSGILSQTVIKPSVYAVSNAAHPYLRVATLREKMSSSKCSVEFLTLEDLGLEEELLNIEKISLVNLYREDKSRSCHFIDGSTPAEKAKILYETYIKEALKL